MPAIFLMTIARMREAAMLILALIGGVMALFVARLDSFETTLLGVSAAVRAGTVPTEAAAPTGILLGSLLLTVFGCLMTVFNAASDIPRDISSRMVAIILSKPLSRRDYLLGKAFGIVTLGTGMAVVWISLMLLARLAMAGPGAMPVGGDLLLQYLPVLVLLPVTAISVCVSCFLADVPAMIVASVYLALGFAVAVVPIVRVLMPDPLVGRILLFGYYWIPNLSLFFLPQANAWHILGLLGYAAAIGIIFLSLGRWRLDAGDVF